MRQGNITAALITFALGLFIVVESNRLPAGFAGTLGADVFPRWLGTGIMALSLFQMLSEFFPKLRSSGPIAWPKGKWRNQVLYVGISITIYLSVLDIVGFSLGTFLLVAALVRIFGQYRWLTILGVALFSATLCTTVFKIGLEVQLPNGLLGF